MSELLNLSSIRAANERAHVISNSVREQNPSSTAKFVTERVALDNVIRQKKHSSRIENELSDSVETLKKQCEEHWKNLIKQHSSAQENSSKNPDSQPIKIATLQTLLHGYDAEVSVLRQHLKNPKERASELKIDQPVDAPAILLDTQRDVDKNIRNLHDCINAVREETKDEEDLLRRQIAALHEHRIVQGCLVEKDTEMTPASEHIDTAERVTKISQMNESLMAQLGSFLEIHYPEPPPTKPQHKVLYMHNKMDEITLELTLPSGTVTELDVDKTCTVAGVKTLACEECEELQGKSSTSYLLKSAGVVLSSNSAIFVESHPAIQEAIKSGETIKISLISPPKPKPPSSAPPGKSLPPAPSGSLPPPPSGKLPQPPSKKDGNSAKLTLPSGLSLMVPIPSGDTSAGHIKKILAETHQIMRTYSDPAEIELQESRGVFNIQAGSSKSLPDVHRLQEENTLLHQVVERLERQMKDFKMAASIRKVEVNAPEMDGTAQVPPEERPRIPVQVIFPGDYAISLPMSRDLPLWSAKAWVWRLGHERGLMQEPLEHHCLTLDGSDEPLFNESMTVRDLPFEADDEGVVRGTIQIIKRPDISETEISKEEKRDAKKLSLKIGSLIGRPLCWTSGDDEVSKFRHSISQTVAEELNKGALKKGMNNINSNRIPEASYPDYVLEKFPIRFRLFGRENFKAIFGNRDQSVNEHLEMALKKFKGQGVPDDYKLEDYVIKARGLTEYMEGEHKMGSYVSIRNALKMKEKIELLILPRSELIGADADPRATDKSFFRDWHEPNTDYDHSSCTKEKRAWDEMQVFSIRDIKQPVRVRILGLEGLNFETWEAREALGGDKLGKKEKCADYLTGLHVGVNVVHGGSDLCPPMKTRLEKPSTAPRFHEWCTSTMMLPDLPHAARMCFTLYGTFEKDKKELEVPLGWVNLQLIDYESNLKAGMYTMRLWPDGPANPIGTCLDNERERLSTLTVSFDTFALPVIFPADDQPDMAAQNVSVREPSKDELEQLKTVINTDPIYTLTERDKELLITFRHFIKKTPKALAKYLMAIPYNDPKLINQAHAMLALWATPDQVECLELLDSRFADRQVRQYAVSMLEQLTDDVLVDYMLQLVQVLKYEPYHDSALSRFLLRRALNNRIVIGHNFFWLLKGEMHVPEINERYGMLLEAYLRGCGCHLPELEAQTTSLKDFVAAAEYVKQFPVNDRKAKIQDYLAKKIHLPDRLQLPLNSAWEVKGLRIDKCKSMDSKKVPLWLVYENADPQGDQLYVIFKAGDDLRQDMLTLQLIRIMDKIWQAEGLDLYMSPYQCVSTGDEEGMLEIVLNSDTTANITKAAGGASAAFSETPIADWLKKHNPREEEYQSAVNLFAMSCAGYCVATYVLGIGDRHNDNVMLKKNGQLFHIDFGHFLGNIKRWKGIKRERAAFVFTPDFAYVMGGKGSAKYQEFVSLCCRAFNILRKKSALFFNLFALMLSTGIPELMSHEDMKYLRKAFSMELTDEEASKHFEELIDESLSSKATRINNAVHIMAHS